MRDSRLADNLADELGEALRTLLGRPMLDAIADNDEFRVVARHQRELATWFEETCGWSLVIDVAAGFARLEKRSSSVDVTRPLVRSRGNEQPFDRRRYELLCHLCAELVRHTVTTIGLLATSLTAEAGFDSSRRPERAAFVDALRTLLAWGAVDATSGDVDSYIDSDEGNAVLTADIARIHRLLAAAAAPSTIDTDDPIAATEVLLREPRYGGAGDEDAAVPEEQRLRWLRHSLARRILDDPVVHFDDMTTSQRDYLANPAGRRWLRDRIAQAGMTFEERADGVLAVDTDHLATDSLFPAPNGIVHQTALLLVDVLAPVEPDGTRRLAPLTAGQVLAAVDALMVRFPGWARTYRDDHGPERLAGDAVALLASFGLVRRRPDGGIDPRPAIARYRPGQPTREPSLFEEVP